VKERGIIMSAPMVMALLEGRKTQTRRIVKVKHAGCGDKVHPAVQSIVHRENGWWGFESTERLKDQYITTYPFNTIRCPYGVVGDRLWVRETHWRFGKWVRKGKTKSGRQKWCFKITEPNVIRYEELNPYTRPARTKEGYTKRPAIFLPRKLSRIAFELTRVRVERLQDISVDDCLAEGCSHSWGRSHTKAVYAELWDSLHGKGAWELNPWVWVLSF
jgi:hypothetical protein